MISGLPIYSHSIDYLYRKLLIDLLRSADAYIYIYIYIDILCYIRMHKTGISSSILNRKLFFHQS